MSQSSSRPVLFFAFANDRENYLSELSTEADKLNQALERLETEGGVQIVTRYRATAKNILDVFQSDLFRDRIAVLHYAGHANGYSLLLEGADGQPNAADAGGLAAFLAQQRGLQLVFLNGCSTAEQTQGLLDAGVPVSITTRQDIDDTVAVDFSVSFYTELAAQRNLQEAFDTAVGAIKFSHGTDPRHWHVVNPPPGIAPPDIDAPTWMLHPNPRMKDVLAWRLPEGKAPYSRVDYYYDRAPRVTNYVERPRLLAEIKQALFSIGEVSSADETHKESLALHGMGGSGKTVMARALCDDAEVQAVFSGGILWTTLGQEPNRVNQTFRDWIPEFGETVPQAEHDLRNLRRQLNKAIGTRKMLLVVDDVWTLEGARSFREIHPNVTLLFTTRDADIARGVDAGVMPIPMMDLAEATELLDEWIGKKSVLKEETKAQVVNRLGRLPLAIKLAGRQSRLRNNPSRWLESFDATKLKEKQETEIHDSLARTFELSLQDLEAPQRILYPTLAIFREDEPIAEQVITTLWRAVDSNDNELDKDDVADMLDEIADRALLDRESRQDEGDEAGQRAYRIHDLLRELMASELGTDGVAQTHSQLLEHHRKRQDGDGWHTAEDDGYLYEHLVYHLKELAALNPETEPELHALFANHNWMHARVEQDGFGYGGYTDDLLTVWEIVHQQVLTDIKDESTLTTIGTCVRYALISSSINSLASNYVPELVVAALKHGLWSEARAISVLESMTSSEVRLALADDLLNLEYAENKERIAQIALWAASSLSHYEYQTALSTIAPFLPKNELEEVLTDILLMDDDLARTELLSQIPLQLSEEQVKQVSLSIAENVNAEWQAYGLSGLVLLIDEPLRYEKTKDILASAFQIEDPNIRHHTFRALAALLSGEQKEHTLDEALRASQAVKDESSRASALSDLAPQLSGTQLDKALEAALAIESESDRASALGGLAPQLSGTQFDKALEATLAIADESSRASALSDLAPQLSGTQLDKALEATLAFENNYWRASALRDLAPQLSGTQLDKALAALTIADESSRAFALISLAPQLSGTQLDKALAAVFAIEDESNRAYMLSGLAPQLSSIQLEKALAAALTIEDKSLRVSALQGLAPQLSEEPKGLALEKALAVALTIEEESDRVYALRDLALHLPEERKELALEKALAVALAFKDESDRVYALSGLAPQLSGIQLDKALAAVFAIEDESDRVYPLSGLAPQLSGIQLEKALAVALTVADESDRVYALSGLASQLSEEQKEAALEKALAAALTIEEESFRAYVLHGLVLQLSEEQKERVQEKELAAAEQRALALEKALVDAFAIADESYQAFALIKLVPELSGTQLEKALAAALTIEDERFLAYALSSLAPQLSGIQLDKALTAALIIEDEHYRASVLRDLTPQLSGIQLDKALAVALAIEGKSDQASALISLAPQLSGEQKELALEKALAAALTIEDNYWRASALGDLAPQLSGIQFDKVLAAALAIESESDRASALGGLASQLSSIQLDKVLAAALAFKEEHYRCHALISLAPQLSGVQLDKALAAALAIEGKSAQAFALIKLVPQLSGTQFEKALAVALAFEDGSDRASALISLFPKLPEEQKEVALEKALAAALTITDESARSSALISLIPELSGIQLDKVLAVALVIDDESDRASVLSSLAPWLSEEQKEVALEKALAAALTITDESARSDALIGLTTQVSGEQKELALEKALTAAIAFKDESKRAYALISIAPQLSGEQKKSALDKALGAALAIENKYSLKHVLDTIYTLTEPSWSASFVRTAVIKQLQSLGNYHKRRQLLQLLHHGTLFTEPFFPAETPGQIVDHIHEICTEWRWL